MDEISESHNSAKARRVRVIVGPEAKIYTFHEHLLRNQSFWFRGEIERRNDQSGTLANSDITAAESQPEQVSIKEISRPDDDVHAFDQFYSWIYRHREEAKDMPFKDIGDFDPETHVSEWMILYSLAVQLGVGALTFMAGWQYMRLRYGLNPVVFMPLRAEIRYLYRHLETTAGLRVLVINRLRDQLLLTQTDIKQLADLCSSHGEFLADIFIAIRRHVAGGTRRGVDFWNYGSLSDSGSTSPDEEDEEDK